MIPLTSSKQESSEDKAKADRAMCAAIRWAEVKAMLGGASVTQGYNFEPIRLSERIQDENGNPATKTSSFDCGGSYLVSIVEVQSDLPGIPLIDSRTDLVNDVASWGLNPEIYRIMEAENISYEEASRKTLAQKGIFEWINDFNTYSRSVANGLRLALVKELPQDWDWIAEFEDPNNLPPKSKLLEKREELYSFFTHTKSYPIVPSRLSNGPDNINEYISNIVSWIYDSESFLKSKANEKAAIKMLERAAFSGGVHRLPLTTIEYAADFYFRLYLPVLKQMKETPFRMIAHLAEGNPKHAFTQTEYKDVRKMGLAYDNSIFIHGMGLDEDDLNHAKQHNISFVWSPLSNLLLYGSTTDIPSFIKAGVNFSLAPDWVPTGSKNILQELKVARVLFDKWIAEGRLQSFSNKELLSLVTINPAKALSLEGQIGILKENALAHLLVIKKQSDDLYNDILASEENDLKLIVIGGVPRSGEKEWMTQLLTDESQHLEDLSSFSKNQCVMGKVIYMRDPNNLDEKLLSKGEEALHSLKIMSDTLFSARENQRNATSNINARAKLLDIDPLFDCDSFEARTYIKELVAKQADSPQSLAEQTEKRRLLRQKPEQMLGETWNSKYLTPSSEEEEHRKDL